MSYGGAFMSKKRFNFSVNGKGYYIALVLCAVAIGISGYLYYANTNEEEPAQLGGQDATVSATKEQSGHKDLPVIATQPDEVTASTTMPVETTRKAMKTVSPVEGQTVAVYAMDELGYNATTRDWRVHNGMDIAAEEGSVVCAAADGEVYTVYEDETMGMTVVIRHEDGYVTRYASLAQEVTVKAGDRVKAGQPIGTVGATALLESAIGSHVHFAVTHNDEPMDPSDFLSLS
jgi:murein DD-endopeptidase MepM/ murein hydrolase activator NlpD